MFVTFSSVVPLRDVPAGSFIYFHEGEGAPLLCFVGFQKGSANSFDGAVLLKLPTTPDEQVRTTRVSGYPNALAAIVDARTAVDPATFSGSSTQSINGTPAGHLIQSGGDLCIGLGGSDLHADNYVRLSDGEFVYKGNLENWISFRRWRLEIPAREGEVIYTSPYA